MKFDLHIHTNRSPDSLASLRSIAAQAKKSGLSGIAITDHDVSAAADLVAVGADNGIWIIRGSEVHTEIGDVIVLFLMRPVKSRSAESLIREVHDQGGVAVLAHPYKYNRQYPARVLETIDAVETVNGRWMDLSLLNAHAGIGDLLTQVRGRSAGSDAHFAFEVGRAYWETPVLASTEELKQSILTGRGKAVCLRYSGWLDEASQGIRFLKRPSPKQLARLVYRGARRLAAGPRNGLR